MTEFFNNLGKKDAVLRQQLVERQNGYDGSLLFTFAGMMVAEGSQGLRRLSIKINDDDVMKALQTRSREPLQRALSPRDMRLLFENFTAVLTGVTIQTLEIAAQTQELDLKFWVAKYNHAMSGMIFPGYEYNGTEAEVYHKAQGAHVKKYVDKDPTYASFFENYFNIMPDSLRQTIQRNHFYDRDYFEEFMFEYKSLASLLLKDSTQQDSKEAQSPDNLLNLVMTIAGRQWERILDEDKADARKCGCAQCGHRALQTRILIERSLPKKTVLDDL